MGLLGVAWLVAMVVLFRFLHRSYRQGIGVAITCDGLFVRLPGVHDGMVTWDVITGAWFASQPTQKLHVAMVKINDRRKKLFKQIPVGGPGVVFPTREDAERFVTQVNARVEAFRETGEDSVSA